MASKEQFTITIVDDTPENLHLLSEMLKKAGYRCAVFPRAEMALEAAKKAPPDLFLLDINMPNMNGYEACTVLKESMGLSEVPVIFISALNDTFDKVKAFRAGGVDYITKPFQVEEVLVRISTHLKIRKYQKELRMHNLQLSSLVAEQIREISESQMATIFALAKLSESRDGDTGAHLERVQQYCQILAEELQNDYQFKDLITEEYCHNVFYASPLHDIGKVAIRDSILLKPGRLTEEEFDEMKLHTVFGAETLSAVHKMYPHNNFIEMGIAIARYHHEKWDGSGYPEGIDGEQIPLCARIMAVVDVYDALRSKRCYKEPFSHEKTKDIIKEGSGGQFDPRVVGAFLNLEKQFFEIWNQSQE